MMAKKDRFAPGYSASAAPQYESEGSGSSGRIDSVEGSSASKRKWVYLNSASRDGFTIPMQIIPLYKLSLYERKSLVLRLTSELEQTRLLQSKVESQKKKSVNNFRNSDSNDIVNYSNGQLQVSGLKRSSGLGSAAPGKKNRGWNRGITGRFESANDKSHISLSSGTLKQCEGLLKKLMSQKYANDIFNEPVDVVKLKIPDYNNIIKTPMDLGTIKSKLSSGRYSSPSEFVADVRLTFTNAMTYNPPGHVVHALAEKLSHFFETRWKVIEKKLMVTTSGPAPEKARVIEETLVPKALAPPSKKRKLSPRPHEVIQGPTKSKMSNEEKHKLSMELEGFDGDLPDAVIDFLRAQTSNKGDGGEDEIEIDIDDLSDDTLLTLRKLLDDHLPDNQKNLARSEACEIEVLNFIHSAHLLSLTVKTLVNTCVGLAL